MAPIAMMITIAISRRRSSRRWSRTDIRPSGFVRRRRALRDTRATALSDPDVGDALLDVADLALHRLQRGLQALQPAQVLHQPPALPAQLVQTEAEDDRGQYSRADPHA